MTKRDSIKLEVPGKHFLCIEPDVLPPVGTRIQLDKDLYGDGTTLLLEVTEHEWLLQNDTQDVEGNPQTPTFNIYLKTRIVNP